MPDDRAAPPGETQVAVYARAFGCVCVPADIRIVFLAAAVCHARHVGQADDGNSSRQYPLAADAFHARRMACSLAIGGYGTLFQGHREDLRELGGSSPSG